MFGIGISRAGEIIDLGVDLGIISKSGSWFSYDGSKLAQGRDAAKRVIADNPELADELEAKIMEALRSKSGDLRPAPRRVNDTAAKTDRDDETDADSMIDSTPELDFEADDDEFGIETDD